MSAADPPAWLWVVFTLVAACSQTFRNAMQRSLTARLGTVGATHVRFLFGLPFACVFVALILVTAPPLREPRFDRLFWAWVVVAGVSQIIATALMLAAMQLRSFTVATAYVKSEPVLVAMLGFVFLGDRLGALAILAILVATAGVLLMSTSGAQAQPGTRLRAALLGIAAGAIFALSAVGFRGAIVALGDDPFQVRAAITLVIGLAVQSVLLTAWLRLRSPGTMGEILRAWRPSLAAGALGSFASLCWFTAFALQSAAAVRTLALVEILFAQAISRQLFAQRASAAEALGIALVVAGVAALLLAG
ncbi:MAG: EamA family transporter [Betaproteobacteria bacterium]|nr:EamA family transporter [Betaproteobacteria bacterium]